MYVSIQEEDFDAGKLMAGLRQSSGCVGAVVSMVGLVRDTHGAEPVSALMLEHYPGMTQRALESICEQARARWAILDIAAVHRVGLLRPSEAIVFVGVASVHRAQAFAACEFVMDQLKTNIPIWKKEQRAHTAVWLEAQGSDLEAQTRWR
ncbi:MAG TPA: molybdenum cofactor biosynthesis protein MoaE [Burkholderiaceae bacterium]|nr:molybdenum cofactor biosynthesis protein MoaE [Burkholderiaceae bacterium]